MPTLITQHLKGALVKKTVKKLTLSRETVHLLAGVRLRTAAGAGLSAPPETFYCPTSDCTVGQCTATCLQDCGFTYDLLCYN